MPRRPDVVELERELVRTRWHYKCVRNAVDRLATSLELQVTKLEQLAATEVRLVELLRALAPERHAQLDAEPNLDSFDATLKRCIEDAKRREAVQAQRVAPRQKKRGAR